MPNGKFILEICADSLDCAIAAERAGADRIELCSVLPVGGVTPSAGIMEAARAHLRVPIHVLIRPRPGNFVYSSCEFEVMRSDIGVAKQLGMNGIAVGILDSQSRIDMRRTRELIDLALPMSVTFHRAFDSSRDLDKSLEQVIEIGAERVLTSGPHPMAADSIAVLARLVQAAAGRVTIMPAGGVTADNVEQILLGTSAHEIHSSAGASQAGNLGHDQVLVDPAGYQRRVRQLASALQSLAARSAATETLSAGSNHRRRKRELAP
jgi:copper homeostasis protein